MNQNSGDPHTLFEAAKMWHLRNTSLFADLTEEEIAQVGQLFMVKTFNAHEIVCPPDGHHTHLFLVWEGRVKQYTLSLEGNERIIHIFKAGDAFGGLLMGNMEVLSPWIEALEPTKVLFLDEADFYRLVQAFPSVMLRLFRYALDHHVEDIKRLERFIHMKARDRLLLTLLDLSERIGEDNAQWRIIDPPYTHEELGNMLGLVRTTVSELIAELRSLGVIDNQGRRLLIDLHTAQELLKQG